MAKKYYLDGRTFKPGPGRNTSFTGQANPVYLNEIIEEVVGVSLPVVPATTVVQGIVELATNAEAIAKASTTTVLTPSNLTALGATDTFAGLVELATDAEAIAGISTTVAITPANLTAALATAGDLESVLTNGNTTGTNDIVMSNNQSITAASGGGSLNLRDTVNSVVGLTTDNGGYTEGWVYMTPTNFSAGFGSDGLIDLGADYTLLQAGFTNAATYMAVNRVGSFDTTGPIPFSNILVRDNTVGCTGSNLANTAVFINTGSTVTSTFNAGIDNSAIVSGEGITAKTNATLYCNQLGLNANGSAFETLIDTATLTADRTAEFPDASGVIKIIRTVTTAINYNAQDCEIVLGTAGGGGITITLPDPTGKDNMQIKVKQVDAGLGSVGIISAGGKPIDNTVLPYVIPAPYNGYEFTSNGGSWWITSSF